MDFRLEQLNSGPDGAHVLASWIGLLFSVSVNVSCAPPRDWARATPSQHLHRLVQSLRVPHITDDEYDSASRDLFARILRAGEPLLRSIAAGSRARPASSRLADHLFLPIPLLHMVDDDEQQQCVHDGQPPGGGGRLERASHPNKYFPERVRHAHPGADTLPFQIDPDLPRYHVGQVRVLESLVHHPLVDHVACRVLVDGEPMFCKAERGGIAFGDSVVGRDFRTMLELRRALRDADRQGGDKTHGRRAAAALRVPSLRGVLRHPDEGHVIGFLRDWVPGASLGAYEMGDLPVALRAEWDRKVARTIDELHRLGVYWGAAESESVIIDPSGEPWLVDFGAKVNLGLKREEHDREEGDWLDYDSIYEYLDTRQETASNTSDDSNRSGSDNFDSDDGGLLWDLEVDIVEDAE
ncbi:hypothetical protein IF1G_01059 [Cordyceps javanica]|uniref:Protein kinase domain-containing protein n=1 Tax=Cordyceps javanica TaxID=43265 RepID=A0A545WE81_9HYPO|nr:hypothetical protein IF1G_01059 [Cordyceps javanica]TQW12288.1 lipopolysaccharide kinase (Kdo/WaaP) family domain-containing protein [Cordyceps javanica]